MYCIAVAHIPARSFGRGDRILETLFWGHVKKRLLAEKEHGASSKYDISALWVSY